MTHKHTHTRTRTHTHTLGRSPLDEGSALRRDLYLTTDNNHKRPPVSVGIRTRNLSIREAADRRSRLRAHQDRYRIYLIFYS